MIWGKIIRDTGFRLKNRYDLDFWGSEKIKFTKIG